MTASWYGPGFHGRPTASGEIFDQNSMTAAHKTLPFGTRLRVTNPDKNQSVEVVINDRGPFIAGRDIDLSMASAKRIGIGGVGKVRVEFLSRDMKYLGKVKFAQSQSGVYTIQTGSFLEEFNANHMKESLELKYKNVYVKTTIVKGQKFYRVRVGKFDTKDTAVRFAQGLADEGYSTIVTANE